MQELAPERDRASVQLAERVDQVGGREMRMAFRIVASQFLPSEDRAGVANDWRSTVDGVAAPDRGVQGQHTPMEANATEVTDSAAPRPQALSSEMR